MIRPINLLTSLTLVMMTQVSCSNGPIKPAEQEQARTVLGENSESEKVSNSVALDAGAHNFVELNFSQGSSSLDEDSKTALNTMMDQANQVSPLSKVLVLSWSDEEYPSAGKKKLSKAQRNLAEKRNNSIKSYLKGQRKVSVESYNMAERPNSVSKLFNTSDTKMKNAFLAAGLPTTADSELKESKASHAVVMIKVE